MSFNAGVAWMLLLDPNSPTSVLGRQRKEEEEARQEQLSKKKDEK